ncbi:derlin-1-like [Antechinus flavipes]|uniref:derlin-1-like n=1 Tax=Antechinus flavipes TaxID=38775 RepID=UPI002236010D|nr:derlin-1-like [Antechinus flavipes]
MLLFNWVCIIITSLMMDMQLLTILLIISVLYVWTHLKREMIVIISVWNTNAYYLPWVILVFNYITGGLLFNELIRNLVEHLYYFLMFKYPIDLGGIIFLYTPQCLYPWHSSRRGTISRFGVPPSSMR